MSNVPTFIALCPDCAHSSLNDVSKVFAEITRLNDALQQAQAEYKRLDLKYESDNQAQRITLDWQLERITQLEAALREIKAETIPSIRESSPWFIACKALKTGE